MKIEYWSVKFILIKTIIEKTHYNIGFNIHQLSSKLECLRCLYINIHVY